MNNHNVILLCNCLNDMLGTTLGERKNVKAYSFPLISTLTEKMFDICRPQMKQ